MRARVVVVVTALTLGGVATAPARAFLPSVCNAVPALPDTRAMVTYADRAAALRAVRAAGGTVTGRIAEIGALQVAFGSAALRDAALPVLRATPGVESADAERTFRPHRKPNDPFLTYQWGLTKVGAPRAWDRETGAKGTVTVAVLDTGVALTHPDLMGRVLRGKNVVDNTDDPRDDHGHGTHVAGIVAAKVNNRVGIAGVSWGSPILAVKVLGADGSGSDCDIALGVVSATDAGAKVLNMSLGAEGAPCGAVLGKAVEYARDAGAVPIASSGNSGNKGNPQSTPANCPGVLAVGATDSRDKVAKFSTHHSWVGVSAPGVGIFSTTFDPKTERNSYASWSGTSMAAPFVSGVAALLLARNPSWTPDQVIDRIVATADDRGVNGKDDFYGAGRLNAARALG